MLRIRRSAAPLYLVAPLLALLAGPPAGAQGDGYATSTDDRVTLELSVEDWVETQTATVVVGADLAVSSGSFGQARAGLEGELRKVSDKAPWRLTQFVRLNDDAGYERWRILAEARLPGGDLAGLDKALKAASRPGQSLQIADIDYAPTLAEREALQTTLRGRLYQKVKDEVAALNRTFADRVFRVETINFVPTMRPMPMMAMESGRAKMVQADAGSGAPAVAQKLVLGARVTLASRPPD